MSVTSPLEMQYNVGLSRTSQAHDLLTCLSTAWPAPYSTRGEREADPRTVETGNRRAVLVGTKPVDVTYN
jgi:hypothetical protein